MTTSLMTKLPFSVFSRIVIHICLIIPGPLISAITVSSPIGNLMLPRPFLDGPKALASIHALPFSPVGFSGDTALERSPL